MSRISEAPRDRSSSLGWSDMGSRMLGTNIPVIPQTIREIGYFPAAAGSTLLLCRTSAPCTQKITSSAIFVA